jgi:hypothetical protein
MRLKSKLFYWYVFFLVVYAGFTLLPAPSPLTMARYHLSALELRIIDITIVVILAAIWYVGFYAYAKLHNYERLIQKAKDGKQVAWLSKGMFLMVMWLPVSSVVSSVLNFFARHHTGFAPAAAIINNYLSLAIPLAGVVLIGIGARGLSEIVRQRPTHLAINVLSILLIYIGLIYWRLVVTTENRGAVYHMPITLILLTIVAPYIYMWFNGMLAVYEIFNYRRKVAGVVYRSSWQLLALGLAWLMLLSIVVQYLTTTLVTRLNHVSFYGVLVFIYSILLVYSVGFVLIALGARKLQKIEEV